MRYARAADNAMMWGVHVMRVMVCCLACRLPIFQGHRGATGGPVRGGKRENETIAKKKHPVGLLHLEGGRPDGLTLRHSALLPCRSV